MPAISIHYNLPVHLNKYLSHHLGNPYNLRADEHIISRFILRSLSGKSYTIAKPPADDDLTKTQTFSVIIPPWVNAKFNAFNITPESEAEFALEVRKHFESNLFSYIRAHQDVEVALDATLGPRVNYKKVLSVKNAIERFIDMYGITEMDIKLETLIKRYQRARNNPTFST